MRTFLIFMCLLISGSALAAVQGHVNVYIADDFDRGISQKKYSVVIEGQEFDIDSVANPQFEGLSSGAQVSFDADFKNVNTLTARNVRVISRAEEGAQGMTGVRRLAILALRVVKTAGDVSDPVDMAGLGVEKQRIEAFEPAASFQHITMPADVDGDGKPDVFGPYEYVQPTAMCDGGAWATAAKAAATAQGIDLTHYDHVAIALYGNSIECFWAGMAMVGCPSSGCTSWWIEKGDRVTFHELGHNLGFGHSTTDTNDDLTIDGAYGDNSSPMGGLGAPTWNAPEMVQQSWLLPQHTQAITKAGTYRISGLRENLNKFSGVRLFTVARLNNPAYHYMISYRKAVEMDTTLNSMYVNQVSIHSQAGTGPTLLDAVLPVGGSWTSNDGQKMTVKFTGVGPAGRAIINVSFGS